MILVFGPANWAPLFLSQVESLFNLLNLKPFFIHVNLLVKAVTKPKLSWVENHFRRTVKLIWVIQS